MLCCVSRKSVDGPEFKKPPLIPIRGVSLIKSSHVPLTKKLLSIKSPEFEKLNCDNYPPETRGEGFK